MKSAEQDAITEQVAVSSIGSSTGNSLTSRLQGIRSGGDEDSAAVAAAALKNYKMGGGNSPSLFTEWGKTDLRQYQQFHFNHLGPYTLGAESLPKERVPPGLVKKQPRLEDSSVYPGTWRNWWVYTPAGHIGGPRSVMFFQDGGMYLDRSGPCRATTVLDNLIAAGEIPPTIGVFIDPGMKQDRNGQIVVDIRQRSYEYDSITGQYADFLLRDILPRLKALGHEVSPDPCNRVLVGMSSGAVAAFAACWNRPDAFQKAICHCGSFVNIRGAHWMPYLIRSNPRRPIKASLQSGSHDLDNPHGSWPLANQMMASSLDYAGYDYNFDFGKGGHNLAHGGAIFPETLRWLFAASARDATGYVGGHAFGFPASAAEARKVEPAHRARL